LITYGLRARDVAALTLDDTNWKLEGFPVRERKAGHSTVYPLSATVDEPFEGFPQPNIDEIRHFHGLPVWTSLFYAMISQQE
jgi:hypothetical protein